MATMRTLSVTLLVCVGVALLATAHAQKAPRFKACKRNQPRDKLNECLKDSLQKAIPELKKGLPEFGLYSIDPLRVDSLQVTKSNNQKRAVSVDISFKNLDIIGLSKATVKSVDMDVNKYKMKARIETVGTIHLQGDYTIRGKVLVLPIEGTGKCNITLVNPKGEITDLSGKPFTKDGKQYVQVTSLKFVVSHVDRVYYDFENLFNGNKELGDNINAVLNDNWKVIYDDMLPPLQVAFGVAFKNIATRVSERVPWDVLLP